MIRTVALLVVFAGSFINARPAAACSCGTSSPWQLLESHSMIFRGKVESADQKAGRAAIRVEILYKGEVEAETVEIRYSNGQGASCGTEFKEGAVETVFANLSPARGGAKPTFWTGLCSMAPYRGSPLTYQPALDAYRLSILDAKEAIALRPQSVQAWLALSKLQESGRDYVPAIRTLSKLRELEPQVVNHRTRLGGILMDLGRFEEALAAYDEALQIDRDEKQASRGREQALLKLGRVLELDPTRRDFSSMEMDKVDFSKRELAGARFTKARLRTPQFTGAKLDDADFKEAALGGADFSSASLDRASFVRAMLGGSVFSGAHLVGTDFSGASLGGAVFANSNLTSARLNGTNLLGTDFSGADLSGLDLGGLEMQGVKLRNAILRNTNLSGSFLAGPTKAFRNNERLHGPGKPADLRGADLSSAALQGADFRFALFDCRTKWPAGIDPKEILLIPVTSKNCPSPPPKTRLFERPGELREMPGLIGGERSNLRGPELEKLDLAGIDLSGANLSGFRMWSVVLRGAGLRAVDLRNANLTNSDFRDADLTASDLSGAELSGTDFSGANLGGVKLDGAKYSEKTRWPDHFDPKAAGATSETRRLPPSQATREPVKSGR